MVEVIYAIDCVIGTDTDAVWIHEDTVAPRAHETAIALINDNGMLTSIQHIYAILRIDGDPADVQVIPVDGQLLPNLIDGIDELAFPNRCVPFCQVAVPGHIMPFGEVSCRT